MQKWTEEVLFYSRKTIENNWSRAVLQNWLDTDLYERQGKAITNFALTLPSPQSDLAQEMTRDPYNFDFLTIRAQYDEKELKDALMENVQRLLMELGTGFAFVGREIEFKSTSSCVARVTEDNTRYTGKAPLTSLRGAW